MPPLKNQSDPVETAFVSVRTSAGLKLISRGLILTGPVILFLLIFQARFSRFNPSHYAAKKHLLESQAAQVEVLILGASQSFVGIEPTLLGRPAFNLAANSQSLYYDLELLNKYRPALASLKLVILDLSYLSLEYELDQGTERWRAYYYYYFYSLPHRDWHMAWSARNYSAWFLCGSEISRASVLFGTCSDATREYNAWGGWTNRLSADLLPTTPNTELLRRTARLAMRRHGADMKIANLPSNIARVNCLIDELDQQGIKVLLITPPVTRFYREQMEPPVYQRMQEALDQITKRHGVKYRNYIFDHRFTDADFEDGDHLNARGAGKFSHLLREEVQALCPEQPDAGKSAHAPVSGRRWSFTSKQPGSSHE